MEHNGISFFEPTYALICSCFQVPLYGKFTVGREYCFEYIVDAERIFDDLGKVIIFPENIFFTYFVYIREAITSFSPMLTDYTVYSIYLILCEAKPNLEEIRAYAKIKDVNYIQARRTLKQNQNLIASGDAYSIRKILNKLICFQVHYKIEPEYPYID